MFAPKKIETSTPYESRKTASLLSSVIDLKSPQIILQRKSLRDIQPPPIPGTQSPTSSSITEVESRISAESMKECFVSLNKLDDSDIDQILKDKSAKLNVQTEIKQPQKSKRKTYIKKTIKQEKTQAEPTIARPKRAATPTNLTELKLNRKMRREN